MINKKKQQKTKENKRKQKKKPKGKQEKRIRDFQRLKKLKNVDVKVIPIIIYAPGTVVP